VEYTELNQRIADLPEQVAAAERDELRWNHVWNSVKETQASFKGTRYPTRQDKDDAWRRVQDVVADLKLRQSEWRSRAERRAADLAREVKCLRDDIEEVKAGAKPAREAWDRLKAIRGSFKGTPFPSKESREELWDRLNATAARLEEHSKAIREKREERGQQSARYRDEIIHLASLTHRHDRAFRELMMMIFATPVWLVEKAGDLVFGLDSEKQDLQSRSATMKEGWELLKKYGPSMLRDDGTAARAALDEAQQALNADWDEWKDIQRQAYEARERARDERSRVREERKASSREHVNQIISNLEEKLEKAEGARDYMRGRIEDLEEKRDSAYSDGYREGVSSRIEELEKKLADIEESVDRLNGWIREQRDRLSALD
jgi:chromosome segregation ATPase